MPGNWSTQHRPNNLQRACVTKSELSLNCSDSWNPLAWECKLKAATSSIGRSDIKVTTTLRSALKMFSLFIRCLTTDRITKIKAFHNSRFLDKWTSSCDKLHNMTRCQRNLLWQGPFTSTCPGYTCSTRKSSKIQPPQIQRGKFNLPVCIIFYQLHNMTSCQRNLLWQGYQSTSSCLGFLTPALRGNQANSSHHRSNGENLICLCEHHFLNCSSTTWFAYEKDAANLENDFLVGSWVVMATDLASIEIQYLTGLWHYFWTSPFTILKIK